MIEKISDIEKFLVIAEAGSIHEAAARLEISQPGLSRILKRMEAACGGALFERLPRGVALTPLGRLMSERCRNILRECETAADDARAMVSGRSGTLRLSSGPVWSFAILPQVLPSLNRAYPGVRIQLSVRGYHAAVDLLEQGVFDVHVGGFDSETPLPRNLTRIPLMSLRLGVVAVASHPIFQKAATLDTLCDYPWIDYGAGRPASDHVWPGTVDIQAEVRRQTGRGFRTIVECDASGLALMRSAPYLAYLPIDIAENIPGLPLREVPVDLQERVFRSGLVLRRSIQDNPVFTSLVDTHRQIMSSR